MRKYKLLKSIVYSIWNHIIEVLLLNKATYIFLKRQQNERFIWQFYYGYCHEKIHDDELKNSITIYDEFLRHITMILDRRQNWHKLDLWSE